MKRSMIVILSMGILLASCATIMSGTTQSIKIATSPEGAKIAIYDQNRMKVLETSTPAIVNLTRGSGYFSGQSYRIEVSKDGYVTQNIALSSEVNAGWYFVGNVFTIIIGWVIIDPITGAMWSLSPENVSTSLAKAVSMNPQDGSLCIILKDQIPETVFNTLDLVKLN
jgi:hypothetical protein